MFTGCGTALVTPFRQDLSLDEEALRKLARRQVDAGINFLVPCGTTGESPTLSKAELRRVVEITVEEAHRGKIRVVAGAGGYNTADVIERARDYEAMGADGILSVSPYYNKPTQEGLYQHFKAVHDAVEIPIVIYNIPGRSAVDMSNATMARLAKLPNIVGVKDATNDLARVLRLRVEIGRDFAMMSGEDATAVAYLAQGGDGCISVTANVAPHLLAEMH
ncbi:MAG TPA: 4-hydroxy-tetrahydrodipicolinate synthase, partial [Candidatus Acidoferrales bacterium]|nr:4-hydroxy-tetrahydrodipicolinate synthase [Candidatus Acidoferrales bacterium]